MKKYYAISSVLHILLLLNIAFESNAVNNNKHQKQPLKDVAPKSVEVETISFIQPDKGDIPVAAQKPVVKVDCVYWYGGIGITEDAFNRTIGDVFKGYVADRGGVQPGDVILATSEPDITGEPGTIIILTLKKLNGNVIKVPLIREKICYANS